MRSKRSARALSPNARKNAKTTKTRSLRADHIHTTKMSTRTRRKVDCKAGKDLDADKELGTEHEQGRELPSESFQKSCE